MNQTKSKVIPTENRPLIKMIDDLTYAVALHKSAADVETKARAIKLIKDTLGITEDTDE